MKVIIQWACIALLLVFSVLGVYFTDGSDKQAVTQPPQIKINSSVGQCTIARETLLSPEIVALSLTNDQLRTISQVLCSTSAEEVIVNKEPTILVEPNRIYAGQQAIDIVRQREGELTPAMEHVILAEGYVLGEYHDVGETYASGVGQTGMFKGMSFKESFNHHLKRAYKMFPELDTYSEALRSNLISSVYRGGVTGSPKTRFPAGS